MSCTVVKDREVALKLAKKFRPIIFQEWRSIMDCIVPIQLGSMENIISNYEKISSRPTLNFQMMEDDRFWYPFFLIYHAFDTNTSNPIKLVRKLDAHRHDTESILMRVNKETNSTDMLTVSHYKFIGEGKSNREVIIAADSHAIRPKGDEGPKGNYLKYKDFDFYDLNEVTEIGWAHMKESFGGVSLPMDQYDSIMLGSRSGRLHNKVGDIWSRPDVLFTNFERKWNL